MLLFEYDPVLFDGGECRLGTVGDVHLAEDTREMIFDRFFADEQFFGDRLIGHALCDAFEDFEFSDAERFLALVRCDDGRYFVVGEYAFSARDAHSGINEFGGVCVSREVSVCSKTEGGAPFAPLGGADEKYARRAVHEVQLMEYLTAVKYGDVVAQDEDVRTKARCFFDGFFTVYSFGCHAYPVAVFECTSDADAKKRYGIGYDDVSFRFSHRRSFRL